MTTPSGIFVLGELTGLAANTIQTIVGRFDPKLARRTKYPHVTLAGSSGTGPGASHITSAELHAKLDPIAASTAPIELLLKPAERFPATNIVVLPIDPHGPIRALHDRIATSGLHFASPRFAFTPHVTLNLFRTLTRDELDELLSVRIDAPVTLSAMECYFTRDTGEGKLLARMELTG